MEKFLAQFEKDNGVITDESMLILAGIANGAEQATKATEAYLEGLKKLGIDISAKGNETSDGLSKGIQSVTEDTANLLGSYLNAMRQDVSVKRTLLEQLVANGEGTEYYQQACWYLALAYLRNHEDEKALNIILLNKHIKSIFRFGFIYI
jgi:hypothetical protein